MENPAPIIIMEKPAGCKDPPIIIMEKPAGCKDPPIGEDRHGDAVDGPPWTVVRKGKSAGSLISFLRGKSECGISR